MKENNPILREQQLHPRKLTWNPKNTHLKRRNIFQTLIFGFHVSFQGSNHDYLPLTSPWDDPSKKPRLGASLAVLSALLSALPNVFYERLLKEATGFGVWWWWLRIMMIVMMMMMMMMIVMKWSWNHTEFPSELSGAQATTVADCFTYIYVPEWPKNPCPNVFSAHLCHFSSTRVLKRNMGVLVFRFDLKGQFLEVKWFVIPLSFFQKSWSQNLELDDSARIRVMSGDPIFSSLLGFALGLLSSKGTWKLQVGKDGSDIDGGGFWCCRCSSHERYERFMQLIHREPNLRCYYKVIAWWPICGTFFGWWAHVILDNET